MKMNLGESPRAFFTRIQKRMYAAGFNAANQDIIGPMTFMNGIPPNIAQHVRTLGIRKPEEQVDAAQGYFDVKQGTT